MAPRNSFTASRRSHAILKWLKSGKQVRIEDVSEAFDIQYPQARADLKLLEELYSLSTHRDGRKKVWTWGGIDPDYVDVATVASLELGAIALDIFGETPYGQSIERLADYCRDRVPDEHQARADRLSEGLHLRRTWLPTAPEEILEHVEEILNALWVERHDWLYASYERSDGQIGDYLLLPRRVIWYQGRLWLLALDRQTLKLFDIAGFESVERYRAAEHGVDLLKPEDGEGETDHPAELDEDALDQLLDEIDEDPAEYFDQSFGIYASNYPVERVHLEVRGEWANYLSRYRLHPSQKNEGEGDGTLHVHFELAVCPEFESFIKGMIPDVQIHQPEWLAEEVAEELQMWLDGDAIPEQESAESA